MKIKALMIGAAVLALTAGAAHAETKTTVTKNVDGSTTTTTTRSIYYYPDRDLNNNGIIDSNEFTTYVWNRWDRDGDGQLTDEEWNYSTTRWYKPGVTTYKTYTAWDKNGDGHLDPTEFDTVVTTTDLYKTWDMNADNVIARDEYAQSSFSVYDRNGDGQISREEWSEAY